MRRPNLISWSLLLAACGPPSPGSEHSSPEDAARSFLEAARSGDSDGVRASLVAAERDLGLGCDYGDLGDYELVRGQDIDRDHVVVVLCVGAIRSPLACVREQDGWKISIHASVALLQQHARREGHPASPR